MISDIESTEKWLTANGIKFHTIRHEISLKNDLMHDLIKFEGEYADAVLAKQMFLWDKKDKSKMWVVSADVNLTIGLKDIAKLVGVKPDNMRFVDENILESLLGCRKGTTNLFALLNDKQKTVRYLLDSKLFNAKWASFHPMDNCASTVINQQGILKIKELMGRSDDNF